MLFDLSVSDRIKNLVKFIRFGIVRVSRNLILWRFSSDGPKPEIVVAAVGSSQSLIFS